MLRGWIKTGKTSLTLGSWHQESRLKSQESMQGLCGHGRGVVQCRSHGVGQVQCGHGRGRDYAVTW